MTEPTITCPNCKAEIRLTESPPKTLSITVPLQQRQPVSRDEG